jgi:hypothetical protein
MIATHHLIRDPQVQFEGRGRGEATPLCAGKWDLFESTAPADHEAAKSLCVKCPMSIKCVELLLDTQRTWPGGPRGTWAGQLLGLKNGGWKGVCPACNAADGDTCKSPNGNTLSKAHSARVATSPPLCGICGTEFNYKDGRFRYCSDNCAQISRRLSYERHGAKRPSRTGKKTA